MLHKNLRQVFAAVLALGMIAGAGALRSAGKGSSDIPVTSTLQDTINPTYNIQSDGIGSYKNNVESVLSVLQAALGDWTLDMSNSTSRHILVDFADPVAGTSSSVAPFSSQMVHARIISKCSLVGINYRTIAPGNSVFCPLHVNFTYKTTTYNVEMNPQKYSATEFATVTCTSKVGSPCTTWTIEPLSSSRGNIAELLIPPSKPNQNPVPLGEFYMTFSITVTNP
jgi:hypothetical protein